jgi:gamma-glutamyl phosphate reductase
VAVRLFDAFNAYNRGITDILAGTDLDDAVSWIKHYCSKHPTAVVHVAAEKLIRFMQER